MKAFKWLSVACGIGAVWYVARAVVVYLVGIVAFFVAAFEASVQDITRATERLEVATQKASRPLPRRLAADRALRKSDEPELLIDLREELNVSS
jgi:flagellar biosynthesis/type III secretory pathway M-ring protein FliF/YscJ